MLRVLVKLTSGACILRGLGGFSDSSATSIVRPVAGASSPPVNLLSYRLIVQVLK
jgi:hypothetical protein